LVLTSIPMKLTAKPEQNWIEGRLYGQAWQKTL
jgi:hypothetical protein